MTNRSSTQEPTMRAVTVPRYGGPEVLAVRDVPRPAVGHGEILVRTVAASVNAADWHLMRADPFFVRLAFGLRRPRLTALGADVAGIVEEVGDGVADFARGDVVFGDTSSAGMGAFAEYVCAPSTAFCAAPRSIALEEAAAIPLAAGTALQGLRDHAALKAGQSVLVVGASGGVGSYAVQIAKTLGARVTAVCSGGKVEAVATLGADRVIDYTTTDVANDPSIRDGEFDVILDAGAHRPMLEYRRVLSPRGTYLLAGGGNKELARVMFTGSFHSRKGGQQWKGFLAKPNAEDLAVLAGMVDDGTLRPLIGARYTLEDTASAIAALEGRAVAGKIVVVP